jgi:hypothetical protein
LTPRAYRVDNKGNYFYGRYAMGKIVKNAIQASDDKKRKYLSQSDAPSVRLDEALRVPTAIMDNYGGGPVTPVELGSALEISPTSGQFRTLSGAAIGYGLTEGGGQAGRIKLKPLALRILKPQEEGDDLSAKREALLTPRVIREFLQKYDGASIPKENIGHNVLEGMGVPHEKTSRVFALIVDSAESLGLISKIKEKKYVNLKGIAMPSSAGESLVVEEPEEPGEEKGGTLDKGTEKSPTRAPIIGDPKRRRVYITHGTNRAFVEPIKRLLKYGELDGVVSIEHETVAQPVPDKVMEDMRSCGAAIIHIDAEQRLMDTETHEHIVLNPNVLIEIGAAMALYGRRYIFLVREGVRLPSNLQGLYEVRYSGDVLSGDDTIKLMGAINDMKGRGFPEESPANK